MMSRRILLAALAPLLPAVAAAQPKKKSIPLALAFVNFIGKDAEEIAGQDVAALLPLFDRVENRTTPPKQIPTCQVLFLYAHLEPDGTIRGTKWGVRDMVLLSKASIVVVASPNSGESIMKAASAPGPKSANIVFTMNRRGTAFPTFFRKLFERMRDGEQMMLAWVQLAPQGVPSTDAPETMMLAEGGALVFPK
jgi:hypothetical protein